MQHRQAPGRSEAGLAVRGPGRGGKPAETGGGTTGVESQLVELKTRVGGLETVSARAEDRWEKWRTDQVEMRQDQAAMKKELAELRKEQTELRKGTMAGFQQVRSEFDAMGQEMAMCFRRVGEKVDMLGQKMAEKIEKSEEKMAEKIETSEEKMEVKMVRLDEKVEKAREEDDQRMKRLIFRLEMVAGLILAAILGTGIFG